MKKYWISLTVVIIWLLPILYVAFIYADLPARVALHFGTDGKPDRYGSKTEMLWMVALLSLLSIGMYLLIRYLTKIDPKKNAGYASDTFKKIAFVLVLFLSAILLLVIHASATGSLSASRLLFPLLGLFFAALGNLMHNVKPNYFVGVRTPWALENADNWRATHQLAGKLWFAGGLVIAVVCLLIPFSVSFIVFISIIVIITLLPVIYSYRYFKKHRMDKQGLEN